jgi:hypothetical protein
MAAVRSAIHLSPLFRFLEPPLNPPEMARSMRAPGAYRSRWRPIYCIEALEEALTRFGAPEIFNGSGQPITSMAFTAILLREKVAISMDGRGAWRDNVPSACGAL